MVYKKTIKNRDVYASATEIGVLNQTSAGFATEQFAGAYKLDEPLGPRIAGTFVKDGQGNTRLFQNPADALDAAFPAAEAAPPYATSTIGY